jgi:hypothetical protein
VGKGEGFYLPACHKPNVSGNLMKTTPQLFIIGLLLTVTFCGRTSNNEIIVRKPKRDTTENYKKTKDSLKNPLDKKIDYIIFGRFCGECGGECATMYKLDILNNKLFADHTDSYWEYKRGTPMKFATTIVNKTKESITRQILDSIPNFILVTTKPIQKFGCPDCTDGCGIYLEIKDDTTVKKFYIDNQTEQLTGDIKLFAEYIKKIIDKL